MRLRRSRRAALAATAGGALIAASLAACGPTAGSSADATSSATTASDTAPDGSLDSMPFGSVGGGFVPLPGGSVASVPVGAGQTLTVPVAGHGGVPASGAGAVALAVAVASAGGAGGGSVTVYAAGASQPDAPSVSWPGGEAASGRAASGRAASGLAVSGLAVSGLGSTGSVAVRNSAGHQVTVSLDADGYWLAGTPAAAGAFGSLTSRRVARVTVGGGQTATVTVAGHAGVPAAGAGAVALSAAITSAFGAGSVTVYPAGARRPGKPSLSWTGGAAASGLVVSALSSRGTVAVHNSSFLPVTVTLDAAGYWLSGAPAATGTFGATGGGRVARVRVGAGQTVRVPVAGQAGVPASGAGAAALAVAVAAGRLAGSVTLYPASASQPDVASLSWAARGAASGLVVSALSDDGAVAVHNSSGRPVTVTLAAAGYWLSKGRAVSDVTAKPTTVTLTGSDITAVAGDPAASHTVTLAAGVPVPAVGRVLVAPMSATAPDGLLGTVTAVASGPSGTHVVTLSPATLDEAYSTFNVSISHVLTDSDIVPAPGGPAGQTQSTTARPLSGPRARPISGPRARPASGSAAARDLAVREPAAKAPGLGFSLGAVDFTCTGSGGGPTIALTADMTKTSVDLTLNADPFAPNLNFLLTSYPVVDLNVGFTGTLTCKLDDDAAFDVHIPIPGTPGLMVTLSPAFTFSASEQASVDFHWTPRAVVGFDKGPGIDSEVHVFHSGGGVKTGASATGNADLFVGLHADIGLAGLTGVGGDVGPDMPVTYDPRTTCLTVDTQLRADLTAKASVFVKNWTFAIAKGEFGRAQLYQKCGAQTSPSSPASSSPPSTASSSPSSSPSSTASGGYNWTGTALQAPMPGNASGVPDILDVSCWAPSGCVATGWYGDSSGTSYGVLLTDSGGTWTAIQAPLPANAAQFSLMNRFEVSCPAAFQCVAAGTYIDTSGADQGFLLTDADGSWTAQEAPLQIASANPHVDMYGVGCSAPSQCIATGAYFPDQSGGYAIEWTDAGGTWQVANGDAGEVSCWAPSQCLIAGSDFSTDIDGSVTSVNIPMPPNRSTTSSYLVLTGVSCRSATECVAVGTYRDAAGNLAGAVWTESGGTWTVAEAPQPADAPATSPAVLLSGISCWAVGQCLAVGAYGSDPGTIYPLLLTDSGGSWTASMAPDPDEGPATIQSLYDVSCAAAGQCVAAGGGSVEILTGTPS